MTKAWPWPADTPLDIARRLLQSYREALMSTAPDVCRSLDDDAAHFGQGWVVPQLVHHDDDDLLTAAEAALLVGVTAQVIRQWAYRGKVPRYEALDGCTRYRAGDVLDHVATTRRARRRRQGGQVHA